MSSNISYYFSNISPGMGGLAARLFGVAQSPAAPAAALRAKGQDRGIAVWLVTCLGTVGLIFSLAGQSSGAYLFLGLWFLVGAWRAEMCKRLLFRAPLLWLIPALTLASVIWSQDAPASLRAALELGVTVAAASLTAGLLRPRAFLSATLLASVVGALDCLARGKIGMDGMSGTVVFMGIFASKNTLAMFMSLLAIFAAAVVADGRQPWPWRLLGLAAFGLSVPLLIRAHSAGAAVTTILSFMVMGLTMAFARLQPRERMITLICAGMIGVPVLLMIAALALNGTLYETYASFVSGVLGKDPTLTGRTVLWNIAESQIQLHPVLGVGYSAFWIQGHLLPEGIWRAFQIDNRSGFNFQETFLEVGVELGWLGVAALVLLFAQSLLGAVRMALVQRSWPGVCFVTIMFCLLTRTIGEVDVPYPFAITTYILFVIAAYGADFARGGAGRQPGSF